MDFSNWTNLKQAAKIDYLKTILEGADGNNGVSSDLKELRNHIDGLESKNEKLKEDFSELKSMTSTVDHSIGKLKQRMKFATFIGIGTFVFSLGIKHSDAIMSAKIIVQLLDLFF